MSQHETDFPIAKLNRLIEELGIVTYGEKHDLLEEPDIWLKLDLWQKKKICLIASCFNEEYVAGLINGALSVLTKEVVLQGFEDRSIISPENITLIRVPGAYEIPLVAKKKAAEFDALIALGCVIRGKTAHFEQVVTACTQGLMQVMLETQKPVAHAVLAVDTAVDAKERSGHPVNRGEEAAVAALKMLALLDKLEFQKPQAARTEALREFLRDDTEPQPDGT